MFEMKFSPKNKCIDLHKYNLPQGVGITRWLQTMFMCRALLVNWDYATSTRPFRHRIVVIVRPRRNSGLSLGLQILTRMKATKKDHFYDPSKTLLYVVCMYIYYPIKKPIFWDRYYSWLESKNTLLYFKEFHLEHWIIK